MVFKKAVKHEAKLRLGLSGPPGSGKTYSALAIATYLAPNGKIAVVDTERGSASKYADIFTFDVIELDTFHPDKYIEAILEAVKEQFEVLVIDSLTHAWAGKEGLLELHERAMRRQKVQNSYTAWADIMPLQNRLMDTINQANMDIIATMRSKTEYVLEPGKDGKNVPRKVGTTPIQRDGMEYEFDVFGDLDQDHCLAIQKTRCPSLTDAVIDKPGQQIAEVLQKWLKGVPVEEPVSSSSQPTQHETKAKQPDRTPEINKACEKHGFTLKAFRQWFVDTKCTSVDDALNALNKPETVDAIKKFIQTAQPDLEATREKLEEKTKGSHWDAAHHKETKQPAQPANQEAMATDRQLTSIRKLCSALNRAEPELINVTFNQARELLTQLSHTYSEARKAS
jgi:DNA polymerase III delta prime subunit